MPLPVTDRIAERYYCAGGQRSLAKALGLSPTRVNQLLRYLGAKRLVKVRASAVGTSITPCEGVAA
jgi:DNA-binding transcriptional regulator YdaS (Cro superfamily)